MEAKFYVLVKENLKINSKCFSQSDAFIPCELKPLSLLALDPVIPTNQTYTLIGFLTFKSGSEPSNALSRPFKCA